MLHIEPLDDALADEVHALVREYYDKTPANTGLPPYDFDWPLYKALQDANKLLIVTHREGGWLNGVGIYIVTEHAHHKGWLVAECDTLAVDHLSRGAGIGRKLVEYASGILKDRGVQLLAQRYRTCYGTSPLFSELGFTCAEHVYVKEL